MSSLNISIENFIDKPNAVSLQIYDSTNYSLTTIKTILEKKTAQGFENSNYFDFTKDKKIDDFLTLCNTYPHMSDYRYIVITGINEKDSESIKQITNYLSNPMKTTKHIFIVDNKKISFPTEYKIDESETESSTVAFINRKISESNIELKESSIRGLARKTSNKLSIISYIDKIKVLNENNSLNQSIIEDLLNDQKIESFKETYDLMNHINNKDLKACLLEIQRTKFKENIFLEISRLTWRFRTYLKIKSLKNASVNNDEIIKSTRVSKYQFKYFDIETKKKTTKEILEALRELKKVDQMLKSTDLNHENILLQLFRKLCKN